MGLRAKSFSVIRITLIYKYKLPCATQHNFPVSALQVITIFMVSKDFYFVS